MSTKTTFKRIALVAVAALGLGVLSVAPSSAAVLPGAGTNTLTAVSSSTTITAGDTATITFTSSFVGQAAYDSVAVTAYTTSTQAPELRLGVSDSSTSVAGNTRVAGGNLGAASTSASVGVMAAGSVTQPISSMFMHQQQLEHTMFQSMQLLTQLQVREQLTQHHSHGHSQLLQQTQLLLVTQQLLCVLATRQQVLLHSVELLKVQTLQQQNLRQDQSQEQLLLRQSSLYRRMLRQPLTNQSLLLQQDLHLSPQAEQAVQFQAQHLHLLTLQLEQCSMSGQQVQLEQQQSQYQHLH